MSEWFFKARLVDVVEYLPTGVEVYDGKRDYYSTGSIQEESIVSEGRFTYKDKPSRANRLARRGDVLQARMKKTDKGHLVEDKLNEQLISTGFIQVRPYGKTILSKYIFYYFKSWDFLSQRDTFSSGSTQEALTDAGASSISFPLVGSLTQNKIVQKIEELFSKIHAVTEALKRVEANLKRYRASVLKAACEGKLVPTEAELAKKEGRDYEPASVLLERILKERREKWQKENPGKKYKEPKAPDTKDLPELPEGWVWASLEMISEIQGGLTLNKSQNKNVGTKVPYLRVANVQRGFLNLHEMKEIYVSEEKLIQLRLQAGDILFNEGGDRDKVGRGHVWNDEVNDCIHQNHVFRARLVGSSLNPYFISMYANLFGQPFFLKSAKQTTNLASINMTMLKSLPIPIAPEKELTRVFQEIERQYSHSQQVEKTIQRNLNLDSVLKQSILKKAFSGQLVLQDPNDEPASVLLERIKEERAQREAETKTKKTITRKPKAKKKTS